MQLITENYRTSIYWQWRLWSYDNTALYKCVYYYYNYLLLCRQWEWTLRSQKCLFNFGNFKVNVDTKYGADK